MEGRASPSKHKAEDTAVSGTTPCVLSTAFAAKRLIIKILVIHNQGRQLLVPD
jgi:hypothetical protein